MRKNLPTYHTLVVRRDPTGMRWRAVDGIYSSWMRLVRQADKEGIVTDTGLQRYVDSFRDFEEIWPDGDSSVLRRHVDGFSTFLKDAASIVKLPRKPRWPGSFDDAAILFSAAKGRAGRDPATFADRVSAAIRVCAAAGELLGYDRRDLISYSVLTPNAKRVSDGNFATSWRGGDGDAMEIVFDEPASISTVEFAVGCEGTTGQPLHIQILEGGKDLVQANLQPAGRYFRPLKMSHTVERLTILVKETGGELPACISEVRFIRK